MSAVREGSSRRKASGDDNESATGVLDSKRLKSPPAIDRISALPEALIVHIISLLPTIRDKFRTGALSRKWQYLWTHVPELYFDYEGEGFSNYDDFVECVNKTLFLCTGSNVKYFGLEMDYFTGCASHVDLWSRFAARNGIEKFELEFTSPGKTEYFITLPHHLYTNSTFRELRFCFCDFETARPVSWNSLKKLSLSECGFSSEALEMILTGAPVLQIMYLHIEGGICNLNFGNSGLKKLIVRLEECGVDNAELEISAPNLQSLKISGYFRTCKLVDMASLVEANLSGLHPISSIKFPILTREVVYSLLNVHTLTLGAWVIQGMAMLWAEGVHPPLSKCRCLTVDTQIWTTNPSAIASLLKSSAGVETLILTMKHCSYKPLVGHGNSNTDWTSEEEASNYLTHLRIVKVVGLRAYCKGAFSFVQFLLKNAKVLRKMIIYLNMRYTSTQKLFETSQKLLSFPRSSPCAEILLYKWNGLYT